MVRGAWMLAGLVAAMVFAGCSERGQDEGTPEPGADTGVQADGQGGGMAEAGADAVANGTLQVAPFEWDGSVGTMAYACGPAGCAGSGLPTGWDQSMDLEGIVALDVEMAFDALPGQELAFGLATQCDGACDFVTYDSGAGPLRLSADGLDPTHTYTLVAWHPYHGAAVGGVQAGVETAFRVAGELTALV